jgi:uncharacterized protein (TIGR02099 family)
VAPHGDRSNIPSKEDRRIKALPRTLLRLAAGTAAFLAIAFAALVLWLRYVALPSVDQYRADIVSRIEKASGTSVAVRRIEGGWEGLRPSLSLEGLRVADRRGRQVLAIERAEVALSWWALVVGDVGFHDIDIYRPALALRRGADGLVYLADKPLNEGGGGDDHRMSEWLLSQPRIAIHDATLFWRDELGGAPEVQLTGVEIAVRRHGNHHRMALVAMPPRALASRLDARADVRLRREGARWIAQGEAYIETLHADLARVRAYLPLPESLRNAVGSVRVWAKVAPEGLQEVLADMRMRDAHLRLADDALPLELAGLSGRLVYRAQPQGFYFGTEGLRLRLAGGAESQPGSFSVLRATQPGKGAHGEIRANGIDVKLAATLLEHFPVPKDLKAQAVRFAPRGRIGNATFTWQGESPATASAYLVKGRFEDLAVNAVESLPGASGVSGTVEGNEKGGTIRFDSKKATFELSRIFRAPLAIDTLDAKVRWQRTAERLEVAIDEARFANADVEGTLAGTWHSLPAQHERNPGFIDLKGTFSRADLTRAGAYFPELLARTRDWLDRSILDGRSTAVRFELKGDLFHFPFAGGKEGRFLIEGDMRDGRLKYHPAWPSVDAIQGTFRFEGTRMEIRAQRAAIFGSRVAGAAAVIEDFGAKPPVLVIDGQVDTTGADGVRFLRESPLVNGPGAFTRAVAIEGPGSLKLHLVYPLSGTDPVQVAGQYHFEDAVASVGRNLAMRNVRGELAFTEKGVRAPDITGSMFGHPAVLRIVTQPEGAVLTVLEGRIDAEAMRAHLAEPIAARFSGASDWRARLLSGAEGSELAVTSDLRGLGIELPEPLSKAADEARPLALVFSKLGTENEIITVSAGKGVHARLGTREGRWHAALKFGEPVAAEPIREGLWLYGALPEADVDAWQAIFATRGAAREPQAGGADLELRGLDLRLGRVRYMGRDFTQVAAVLQKSGAEWSGSLQGPMVAGEVRWNPTGRGRVSAKLQRLAIGQAARESAEPPQDTTQSELPAIDVAAERFDFRGRTLGRLEVKAEPAGEEWRIEKLNIGGAQMQFTSSGGWRRTGTGSITTLAIKLDAESLNALLGLFGYADYVRRGTGHLEGTLVWPGLPHEFALSRLSGSFRIEARRGQFAKIEPGAGKLLGLLSLQSLPRRATFDFRDVFSEGFAFERIHADVKVARGILLTDNFEISGPAAFVTLAGEVSLPQETQSLTLHVVPEVSEGVALAATLIGTPVLGLSTLVVSKLLNNPFGKVVAYEYLVTGSWDNPTVTRTSAPPKPAVPAS